MHKNILKNYKKNKEHNNNNTYLICQLEKLNSS